MNNNSKTKVGACGICCSTCGLYLKGICPGCNKTKEGVEFLKSINANCPVLECAIGKGMDVCSKDCHEFPCSKFEGWPLTKEWLEMYKGRLKDGK
ncbi:MAG: hypothetical protein COS25_01610 [Candidatus Nealsonbacteria bacterium CG02_land_8_20_14_3_00_37_10]|uniref:DUF3795 domain-containing protein n=2 Tax=Candidatus Nealsoniibacteriota TaxID=1817911 RepID=A0A2G9Z0G5_9BACT|nr:MAG: hypothetical protein COX35_01985 [Candidatus Nealsonbacteria bacterium CG23_combo_of_CG06-09_8_20_14_all_37_18]PIV45106.1 MAG: hypothetical protein COS25_01610 [Candidatus Nealsonbacteria bacterium CG02_land_8_20_14_3_00_37_10]